MISPGVYWRLRISVAHIPPATATIIIHDYRKENAPYAKPKLLLDKGVHRTEMSDGEGRSRRVASRGSAMTTMYRKRLTWGLGLLALGLFTFQAATLLDYPAPTCDEAFYSRTALRYVRTLGADAAWPPIGVSFFMPHGRAHWLILGSALQLFGTSLVSARSVSLVGWLLFTIATY